MVRHYLNLLREAISQPQRSIGDLQMLSAPELHQQLVEWNPPAPEARWNACLQSLFEEQVARRGDQVALVVESERLTYAELNRRANRLAHWLRGRGVVADQLVGLSVERSVDMVVGILGILKAGGAVGGRLGLDAMLAAGAGVFLILPALAALGVSVSHRRGNAMGRFEKLVDT